MGNLVVIIDPSTNILKFFFPKNNFQPSSNFLFKLKLSLFNNKRINVKN